MFQNVNQLKKKNTPNANAYLFIMFIIITHIDVFGTQFAPK